MSDTNPNWLELTVPGLRLRFPEVANNGDRVEMDEFRAHFRTMNSAEVYFEVSRHTGISAQELYQLETAAIRRANPDARISDLVNISFARRDARQFSVRFPDKERVFTLIQQGQHVYRVIYDPRSPMSHDIIGTLEFI